MRQIAWKFTVLCGLLFVTGVACTDRGTARAPRSTTAAAPEATPDTIEAPLTYVVLPGDFLSEIARSFDVTLEELVAANNIANPALIEVGQVLVIPGQQTAFVDPFAIAPAERWPELYPQGKLPPPLKPSPMDELRNRIAALPWPPRDVMISRGIPLGFALTALIVGLIAAPLEQRSRLWAVRTAPRGARRLFRWWTTVAIAPRRSYLSVRRRALAAWALAITGSQTFAAAVRAVDQRYRRVRALVIAGWIRTAPRRADLLERSRPALERIDDVAGRFVDAALERAREVVDTVRERAPAAADGFGSLGDRATSMRRSVSSGAQRARRDVFEPAPAAPRWRSRIAGELATAFERNQLRVRYVPIIDLDAHALSAIEAHLFWQHPQRGLMAARDVHVATQDHPELGAALLEFVIEESCKFLKEKVDPRFPSAQLVVPITLEQIVESEPLAAIDRGLSSANLAIDRLKVSIAEPHAQQDPNTASAFIRNLRSMGIGVHLDDYGMTSPQDLQRLGVSSVTIDFGAAGSGTEARELLTDAVEAAQELRLPVTARHARGEAAQHLQVSLVCAFEAVGEPLPADTFLKSHVDEQLAEEAVEPIEVPVLPSAASLGDAEQAPISANGTVDKQTHRPAGPLRLTRSPGDDDAHAETADEPLHTDPLPFASNDEDQQAAGQLADGDLDESPTDDAKKRPVDAA
ncbi:MAG: EAL domain-containing protein [Chloroflexi bacterium]|nr:EAL domain-containing protein [Chloroflexota bacterium]MDA1146055.1 EAL domain-containing protein [Chloroflexota bacterium]